VVLVEGEVVIAESVEGVAGELVAEHGRVALHEGLEVLLREQMHSDPLDLVGRTAVHGRQGHRLAHGRTQRVEVLAGEVGELVEVLLDPVAALTEDRRARGVDHGVDEGVDLVVLDPLEVIADADVEPHLVDRAESELLAQHGDREVRLDVLVVRLGDGELGGPLAVVALVLGLDARLGHCFAQLFAVDLLDGLQLHEPGARQVGDEDVVGQLGLRPRGRAHGRCQSVAEGVRDEATGLGAPELALLHPEDRTAAAKLLARPEHQMAKGQWPHQVAHTRSSPQQ